MKTIGERILLFDNLPINTVETFNDLFSENPLKDFNNNDSVVIGEITKNAATRTLTINNIEIEHNFERRLQNENSDYLIDSDYYNGMYDF